jgi:thiol-disulfide isomerase/thioredoxin
MKLSFYILILLLPFTGISQSVKVVKYEQLEKYWQNSTDTLYVVNFWATWCKPCLEELPDFLKLNDELQGKAFRMILVSLDFPTDIDQRVKPFIQRKNIKPTEVVL